MSLNEVSKELGVTQERVRQIENKAMRKLSHPRNKNRLLLGLDYFDRVEKIKEEERQAAKEEIENEIKRLGIEKKEKTKDYCIKESLDKKISTLPISIRSFKCLERAGCVTIKDVANLSLRDLEHIRNLGKKSLDEIVSVMRNDYNIIIK